MIEWNRLKNNIYYSDESQFREILVYDLCYKEWEKWTNFVNRNYKVIFLNYKTKETSDAISFDDIKNYWSGKNEEGFMAKIYLKNIQINCFFNGSEDLENDIDVYEITDLNKHISIIDYMKDISKCIQKPVYMEKYFLEDEPRKLIEVFIDEVNYLF